MDTKKLPTTATLRDAATDFLRGGPGARYGEASHKGGTFHSYGQKVALRISEREVWITSAPVTAAIGKHVGTLRRTALALGFHLIEGLKPPAARDGFAPIPPVSVEDALLVVEALQRHAGYCRDEGVKARARRLAEVYRAAADGDGPLADGLYRAMPRSPEEK